MSLFNKKANQNDQIDRISDLPSNVIDGILGNLRIPDLVRTSVLSRKWRYMWTSAPHIRFDDYFFGLFQRVDDTEVSRTMTDVLMRHKGPIRKFYIDSGDDFCITADNLNTWIPFMSRDIKQFDIGTYNTSEDPLPDIIFSCKELTDFILYGFKILSIPPNLCGFKKLLQIYLSEVEFESSAFESFICGCPLLEKLTLHECIGDNLVISSSSLKVLVVLVLELCNTMSICLKKANNLIDFTLKGSGFIKSLPKIKRFTLTAIEKYEETIPATMLTSSFSSLEYLKLDSLNLNERGEFLHIISLLKSAPSLVKLNIEIRGDVNTTQMTDHSKELDCCSYCPKLQTVNISVGACSWQRTLSLIQFILANSPLLKTLTFRCYFLKSDERKLYRISQALLWMERASPRAHVKFLLSTYS